MPIPLAIGAALIAGGANIASNAINASNTSSNNEAQRKWNEKMYAQQRADALTDMHYMNQYNSPAAQMMRLKQAGLNPNLVYGNGAATSQASTPRSSSVESWKPDPIHVDPNIVGNSLQTYQDVRFKEAQTDQLKAQTALTQEQQANAIVQRLVMSTDAKKKMTETESAQFDLDMKRELAPITIESASTGLAKQQADLQYTLDENERKEAMNSVSMKEILSRIVSNRINNAKTEQERKNLIKAGQILDQDKEWKELDLQLKRLRINPNDPTWLRVTAEALQRLLKKAAMGLMPGPSLQR